MRYDRALSIVTASTLDLRVSRHARIATETHARYRARPGTAIAVLTLSELAQAPAGETYQAWVRHGDAWTALGTVTPDANGSARLIVDDAAVAATPDAVQVTLETRAGSSTPRGRAVVASEP